MYVYNVFYLFPLLILAPNKANKQTGAALLMNVTAYKTVIR